MESCEVGCDSSTHYPLDSASATVTCDGVSGKWDSIPTCVAYTQCKFGEFSIENDRCECDTSTGGIISYENMCSSDNCPLGFEAEFDSETQTCICKSVMNEDGGNFF